MQSCGMLSSEEAERIRLRGVAAFLKSTLGQRMLRSPDVRREANFTMRLEESSPTLLQGIVDCAFLEDRQWILIDYKTDRDTAPESFVPRHSAQMNWYRLALEKLTRIPVREMWLYAIRAGEAHQVPRIG